ncbi:MAG: DUF3634 family protein [Planctomycetota bacterium]|jgi:hypothetical protein
MKFIGELLTYLVLVIVGAIIFVLIRSKPVFVIIIRAGKIKSCRGKIHKGFREDCEHLVSDLKLRHGTIKGVRKSGKIKLQFSLLIPKSCHQRFRNAWHFHV